MLILMSITALYQALIKANVPEELAEKAVEGLAKSDEVATKADLAQLESRLTWRMFAIAGLIVAAIGLIVKL